MNKIKLTSFVFITVLFYACQPTAVRETVEPHPVTEEGLIASSIYAAERTGSDDVVSNILRRISLMKIDQREFDTAREFAEKIPSRNERDRTIADIAIAISDQGDRDRARSIAAGIESDYEKSRALSAIAIAYEQARDFRQGRELANEISDPNFRARAFAGIGVVYYKEGYGDLASRIFNQALQAARSEQSLTHHIESLLYISKKYQEAGERQAARSIFEDARRLFGDIHIEQHIVSVWGNLLAIYRKAGQDESVIDDALIVAREMGDAEGYYRDELISRIAIAIAETGDYDRSGSIAGEIGDLPLRSTTFARLAVTANDQNDRETAGSFLSAAIDIAVSIPDGPFKQRAKRDIGMAAVEITRYDETDRLIESIQEPHFTAHIAAKAARSLLGRDDDLFKRYLIKAVAAFDLIEDPVIKPEILFDIAELYERSGYIPDEDTKLIVSKALHAVD